MKKYIISIIAAFTFASCNGFLDEVPLSNVTDKNYYKTERDAEGAINAIYETVGIGSVALWQGTGNDNTNYGGVFFNDYYLIQDLMSDNARHDYFIYANFDNFSINEDDNCIKELWYAFYRAINTANIAIEKIPAIKMNEKKRDHLVAEARFWRGLLYGEMVKLWGNVPYRQFPSESVNELFDVESDDQINILEASLADLKYADEHLMDNYRVGYGRANSTIAKAVYAKIALIKAARTRATEDYKIVANYCKLVIDSHKYDLYPDYHDNFVISNEHGIESILSINYDRTADLWGSQFNVSLLPMDIIYHSPDGTEGPQNANSWVVPTKELFNSYEEGDTRRDITIMKDYTYRDGSTFVFKGTAKYPYYYTKYWDREAEPEGMNSGQNFPYLRYSDILLMYAEALNEINSPTQEAYEAINKVRERAFKDNVHKLKDLTKIEFRKAILDERRWEFAMEASRWFDLVRLSDNFIRDIKTVKPESYVAEKHKLLPIPLYERQLNNKIKQNPGY